MSLEDFEKEALQYISMRSKIEPSELADAVLFLASDEAPHITGVLMEISGGQEWEA
jgi:NAD(P)-dependent dehydrogenase (short-subunit alcohol dehydrogenase family)